MIFNKENRGASELRSITGSYYASNDFDKVRGEIELAREELCDLIGKKLYDRAERAYKDSDKDDAELVLRVQRPIAIMATLRLYQKNDISHEDDGRKFKIDRENERLPWEWQLDRDDERHLEEYYKAVDGLIRFLNDNEIEEWKETRTYKTSQKLLIKNGTGFHEYFPIDNSERMFVLLVPFLKECQMLYVRKGYGADGWEQLVKESNDEESDVRFAACKSLALFSMSMALRRLPLSLIPGGVIKRYIGENGTMETKGATMRDIKIIADWMEDDARTWLDEMKKIRDNGGVVCRLIPENEPKNKFMQL